MTIDEARELFTYLESGKVYFNHAAISPLSEKVIERLNTYLRIRSEGEIEPYFLTLDEATGAKQKLASLIGTSSKNISWSANVSDSLNILAQGLKWEVGDEVILNNIEFPSNVYPFLNLEKQGVKVLFAKAEDGKVDMKQISSLISEKTKLISISMVQFLTGYRANLKEIGELCDEKNIIFCVDGIQGVGAVKVDVEKEGIDFFAGGTHKWLMGLQGLGYFYLSPKISKLIEQKHVGWTSVKNPWELTDYNLNLIESNESFQLGTLPRINIIALNAALSLFESVGYEKIQDKIIDNTIYLRQQLISKGFDVVALSEDKLNMAGITSFKIRNAESIYTSLKEKNIECSVREGMLRISPHFYNTRNEIDYFLESLKEICTKI